MSQPQPSILRWAAVALLLIGAGVAVRTPKPPRIVPDAVVQRVSRSIYRHSVVPGGVFNPAEAVAAVARDRVVAAHYQGFAVGRAAPVQISRDFSAFVSYRRGDTVYWTSRPVRVPGGELLLSDGAEMVRARCGNRLSDRPRMPTAFPEPTPSELESSLPPFDVDPAMLRVGQTPMVAPAGLSLSSVRPAPGSKASGGWLSVAVPGGLAGFGPAPATGRPSGPPDVPAVGGPSGDLPTWAVPWPGPAPPGIWRPGSDTLFTSVPDAASASEAIPPSEPPYFPGHISLAAGAAARPGASWRPEVAEVPPGAGSLAPPGGSLPIPPGPPMLPPYSEPPPATSIPEPSSQPLLLLVIAGLFWYLRTRA